MFWKLRNVIITPHGSGESRHSEDRVLDILDENLNRLWNGQTNLKIPDRCRYVACDVF